MAFPDAMAVLETHLDTAGAQVSPTMANVAQGERDGNDRRIDYWVDSIGGAERFGGASESYTDRMFGVTVSVRAVIPVRDKRVTLVSNVEADLYTVSFQIAFRVLGDYTLGGNCTAATWQGAEFGWERNDDGTWLRTSTTTLVFDFVEQITLAP